MMVSVEGALCQPKQNNIIFHRSDIYYFRLQFNHSGTIYKVRMIHKKASHKIKIEMINDNE